MKRYAIVFVLIATISVFATAQKSTAVNGVTITVENMDKEVAFFTENLDFKKIKEETLTGTDLKSLYGLVSNKLIKLNIVTLSLGSETIRLMDFDGIDSRSIPADMHSNDLAFQHIAIVVSNMDSAYQRLLKKKVTHVSTSPQTLPNYLPNAAGIKAFYFRDPEGHNLELIWFPKEKGNPKWQSGNTSSFFLGIDHTAIGISDTEQSMAFYRDMLGLVYGGHSENYGSEQEHLNQVYGARLDINGLHADKGMGVEFLRYIAPPGGRPYPSDSQPADLWHYQTEIEVEKMDEIIAKFKKEGMKPISKSKTKIDGQYQFLLRDPDGHAVMLRSAE